MPQSLKDQLMHLRNDLPLEEAKEKSIALFNSHLPPELRDAFGSLMLTVTWPDEAAPAPKAVPGLTLAAEQHA
jgi:hypothetical protein